MNIVLVQTPFGACARDMRGVDTVSGGGEDWGLGTGDWILGTGDWVVENEEWRNARRID
jgi:hypothetical protein